MRRPRGLDDDAIVMSVDAIVMSVDELVMRHESGGRFRLAALLYAWRTTTPAKVAGRWPLILIAEWAVDPGRREAVVAVEGQCVAYGAYPGEKVAVIPVHPAQASRSLEAAVGASAEVRSS